MKFESPDLFRATEGLVEESPTIIDLSLSEDEISHIPSPTLNKSKKPYRILKEKSSQEKLASINEIKCNIFKDMEDDDETFIENVPIHQEKKLQVNNNQNVPLSNANQRNQLSPSQSDRAPLK